MVLSKAQKAQRKRRRRERNSIENHKAKLAKENEGFSSGSHVDWDLLDQDGLPQSDYEELEVAEDDRALMPFLESDVADCSDLDGCDGEEIMKAIWPEGSAHFQYTPKVVSKSKDDAEKVAKVRKPIKSPKPSSSTTAEPRRSNPRKIAIKTKQTEIVEKEDETSRHRHFLDPIDLTLSSEDKDGVPRSYYEKLKAIEDTQELMQFLERDIADLKPIRNPLNPNGKLIPAPIPKQTKHTRKKEALKEMGSETSMKMVAKWCQVKKVNHHIDPILLQFSKPSVTQISLKRKNE